MRKIFILTLICLFAFSYNSSFAQPLQKYELRAAWIATVDNIDWPSRGNYDPELQKKEFTDLLNMHQRNGMNAVVVQIRPATDAFYPSPFDPWSEWLTGKQGKAPNPFYDPLEFMIEETHKRGMEFHAWFNPYRAVFNIRTSSIAPDHITRKKPEWFLVYGDKKYFDPAIPEVRSHVTDVIRDVVKRYDIDAVHFDDYFYPYKIAGKEFPDYAGFKKYGNGMARDDWRRSNVDSIIKMLHDAIKEEKPWVKFGISPFGVWRNQDKDPTGSPTRGGLTNYDDLYADILLWLKTGWIDYVAPQLYWEIGHRLVAYETLVDWWANNSFGKHLYIGHGYYRASEKNNLGWRKPSEIPEQINLLRRYPTVQGSMYFSSKSFLTNPFGWNDSLRNVYYKYQAIVPVMHWMNTDKPSAPSIESAAVKGNKLSIMVKRLPQNQPVRGFVLYRFNEGDTLDFNNPTHIMKKIFGRGLTVFEENLPSGADGLIYAITTISYNNVESDPAQVILRKNPDNTWTIAPN